MFVDTFSYFETVLFPVLMPNMLATCRRPLVHPMVTGKLGISHFILYVSQKSGGSHECQITDPMYKILRNALLSNASANKY